MLIRSLLAFCFCVILARASGPPDYMAAARQLDATVERSYAYLDKLPSNTLPQSSVLSAQRNAVSEKRSLLRYSEDRIASLADHHAITGSSFADSWAVIPTYVDLWILARDDQFFVDAVRDGSPAMKAGVSADDRLIAVNGVAISTAVEAFWSMLGLPITKPRAEYAARVLAAGRMDRHRVLKFRNATGFERSLALPSLYSLNESSAPVIIVSAANRRVVHLSNSLGDDAIIAAFDAAMAQMPKQHDLVIDLRDTPSGGNMTIARDHGTVCQQTDRLSGSQSPGRRVHQWHSATMGRAGSATKRQIS